MTQHASLKIDSVGKKHRSVLKRYERIRKLQESGKWQGRQSVHGLPKIKSIKMKVRKSHDEKPAEAGTAEAGAKTSGASAADAKGAKKQEKPEKK